MKLFFALWPPRETARALAGWGARVQRDSGGRPTDEANIHLTLAFLGEVEFPKASAAAHSVRSSIFELQVDRAKYWKHNKIIWVGPSAHPPQLDQLVAALHGSLRKQGFVLDERPFAAHITLVRKAALPRALAPLPDVRWPVREFVLARSVPTAQAVRYEIVERFRLA